MELTLFCMLLDKPLVILFDEADCLSEGTLISFLRQLRDGYEDNAMRQVVVWEKNNTSAYMFDYDKLKEVKIEREIPF